MRRICGAGNDAYSAELKRKFQVWMHEDLLQKSFAAQAKNLCEDKNRKDGVRGAGAKRQKREADRKIKSRHYFVTNAEDVQFFSVKMNTIVLPSSKIFKENIPRTVEYLRDTIFGQTQCL